MLSNGQEVTLTAQNSWQDEIDNLPKYGSDGNLIEYTWMEETLPAGYYLSSETTTTDSTTGTAVTTLTNTYTDSYMP